MSCRATSRMPPRHDGRKQSRRARRRLALGATLAALATPSFIHAQTVTNTWIGTSNGNWSDTTKWFNGVAPPANGTDMTVLQFNAAGNVGYNASNDLGDPFAINGIVFNSTSTGGVGVVNATSNTLQFTGASPFVTQSNFGMATITAPFSLDPTSGDFTISASGLGSVQFSGQISGSRQVVVQTSGAILNGQEIRLTAANTHTQGVRLISGNLALGSASATGSGGLIVDGGSVQSTSSLAYANNVTLNATMRYIGGNNHATFSGVLSGNAGVTLSGTAGAPSISFIGANTYTGATTIDYAPVFTSISPVGPGQINIINANGRLASTSVNIRAGGTFAIGNSTTAYTGGNVQGRIGDATAVNMNGGYLSLTAATGNSHLESVGVLTVEGGHNVITVVPNSTAQARITFASLARTSDRGTVFIRGMNLGNAPANNVASVFFDTAPSLTGGGGAAGTPDVSVIPFAFADRTNTGSAGATSAGTVGFVTYDATNGVRVLNHATEYRGSLATVTGNTNNALLTSSENPAAQVNINALFVRSAGVTIGMTGETNTLNFPNGNAAFIYTTNALTINTPLTFNDNEGKFFTASGSTTVNGVISGTNGITKIGANGALVLANSANTYEGPTSINGGPISFADPAAFGNSDEFIAGGNAGDPSTSVTLSRPALLYTGTTPATLTQDVRVSSGLFRLSAGSASGPLTLAGTISGPGGMVISNIGAGASILLAGNNTYTGQTRILAGNLVISSDDNLGNGGALDIGASSTTGLTLNGNWIASRQVNISAPSQVNDQGFNSTLNGVLTGSSPLTKVGGGKLTLNAANPYTGSMTISSGILEVNGSIGPSSMAVTIAGAASLSGTGAVYRAVSLAGTVAPGTSIGQLTLSGTAPIAPTGPTFEGGGSYEWEIEDATPGSSGNGVRWDHLSLNSLQINATSGNKFTIKVIALPGAGGPELDNFDPHVPRTWTIATAASGTVGGFAVDNFMIDLTQFENNNTNAGFFAVSHSAGELRIHYVPEPGMGALLIVGAGMLLRRRRSESPAALRREISPST